MLHALLLAMVMAPPVTVDVDTSHRVQWIRPLRAMGTAVDSDPRGKIPLLYSPARVKAMLGTGLGMVSYRLYTELSIQDWHWNPRGSYSDAAHERGYWTSSADASAGSPTIVDSFGYRLPHRGSTRDQGDDDGYSRIDDGDPATYWKSDPYLARRFTGDPDSAHPQWIVVQFPKPTAVDAVRIAWANPFATRYRVQYWSGSGDAILDQASGTWQSFASGAVSAGGGGTATLRLARVARNVTFVRVLMTASSDTCDTHGSADPRNCVGYAVGDLGVGTLDGGSFHDAVVRSKCGGDPTRTRGCRNHQTSMWTSSDDPWHAESDRVTGDQDQPGLDVIAGSPLSRGLPTMYPVPLFYSTPQNAANEVRYLEARGYPISYIEMGEEADGQYALPEDYAALFVQWARAIHAVDPHVKLGGPVFQGVNSDVKTWRDASGDTSWLHRFLRYLKTHDALGELAFMSFEHYPFKNCDAGVTLQHDLLSEPALVSGIARTWRGDGLPADVPMFITESSFSADGTSAPQRIAGGLWLADWIGSSFASGISAINQYQIEPEPLERDARCGTWGAYNPFIVDASYRIRARGAAFYIDRLLTREWVVPGNAPQAVYPVRTSLGRHLPLVTAYAVHRSDAAWSVLLVNKDRVARTVRVRFGSDRFDGPVSDVSFGPAQYAWGGRGPLDLPKPDAGLARSVVAGGDATYTLPARSVNVLRGAIAQAGDAVTVDARRPLRSLQPLLAIGSTVDKEPAGSIPSLYSAANVRQMLAAGAGWLSYRLFTELSVQDWHWNPHGHFSEGDRGYWTSSASTASPPIADSFGYRLAHRGNTTDQGNNADYSRIDDGDPSTYWKSDPYLTHAYTGDPDAEHAQWIVVDLGAKHPVDAVRIAWVDPYATQYRVDYWTGDDPIDDPVHGTWEPFERGVVRAASRSEASAPLRLSARPRTVRYVRVRMTASSGTCDTDGSADPRDCVGYAVGEIYVGEMTAAGGFHDWVLHAPCGGENPGRQPCGERQTATYVSSTDPWHEANARVRDQEQPGLDVIARSGLTRGLPATYPVAMWYSTPQNAVAEVRYLRARGYPVGRIELGEEVDGQYGEPEDYGALYVQWAKAIHAIDPTIALGGPVFSGVNADLQWWPDARGNVSWLNRFLAYLKAHDAMNQLSFMSFEHYPFDGCEHGTALLNDLLAEPGLIASMAHVWRKDGLPASIPEYVTEANFSAVNFTQTPMQIEGALWQADYMASALTAGIAGAVYYQYEPVPLSRNTQCPSDWGNLTMFDADAHAHIRARTAQFFALQMMTQQWFAPGNGTHELYAARANIMHGALPAMSAYALKRPDGTWSVMLVNKDAAAHDVAVRFDGAGSFVGVVTRATFGSGQYVWRARGRASIPDPDGPIAIAHLRAAARYVIPAQSITVLRGRVAP